MENVTDQKGTEMGLQAANLPSAAWAHDSKSSKCCLSARQKESATLISGTRHPQPIRPGAFAATLTLAALLLAGAVAQATGPVLTNAVLFVTQVPVPDEVNASTVTNVVVSVASALGNHLADTAHCGRGGALWIRYADGTLKNLTLAAGYGVSGGTQHTNGIAVRQPSMHWSGTKAVFSMVAGAPQFAGDTSQFFWQLYEITNFVNSNAVPIITKVPNQPTNFNNVSPCYGTDDRILFTSDRPRDGSAHLYPQLDEYNDIPTVTGLWSLDSVTGNLSLLNHTPSGAFTPFVDSFGRVIFTRWDHLVQDRNATDDRLGNANNGTFNYADEGAAATYNLADRSEFFPEPRTFDTTNLAVLKVNGNAFNSFFPWQITEDGTDEEVVNHLGRHDLQNRITVSFTNDSNLIALTNSLNRYNTNWLNNFFQLREDPLNPGRYFGVDAPDFGTHAAGQILTLYAPPSLNPDFCYLTYITAKAGNGPNAGGAYRTPVPMVDGKLLAVYTSATQTDTNIGTALNPASRYDFRLKTLVPSGSLWVQSQLLTPGFSNNVSYYRGNSLLTYSGLLWELDPVEVRPQARPARLTSTIQPIEQQVFDEEGVDVNLMRNFLKANNLALLVSHNVTRRDRADKQQPYNLRIAGTTNVTLGTNVGKVYDLEHIQFLQADQRRGLTLGGVAPAPGRRVLPTPLHEPAADNVPNPSGPAGSMKLADDGSFAALVPARRAMTWQLLGTNGESIVKERYWVTFAPGEIRTCKNCHGINTSDQAGNPAPNNKPQALRDLLNWWKSENTPQVGVQSIGNANYLALTFKRRSGVTNVTHAVEVSEDLQNWTTGHSYKGTNVNVVVPVTTEMMRVPGATETIQVIDNQPMQPGGSRFMRVKVSSP
ncbi:MAG TPA: hypothetical protein VGE41_09530 [Verrucomicrobiae bacterium]|jgi:hypothetical protein